MDRNPVLILLVLIIAIGAAVALFMILTEHHAMSPGNSASSTPSLVGQALFSDGEHGLTIRYPEADAVAYDFTSFYHLPANWRRDTLPEGTGTPVVAIIGYRTQSDHAYPRYFDAEVRIGSSNDPREVARCETAAPDSGEAALPDVILGGTAFKAFSLESAGMMQYLKGVSYRKVHEGSCIAIEKLETGSSYHDDPVSKDDIPQTKLDDAYSELDAIVSSFAFARP